MPHVFLSIGSNLAREEHIQRALHLLYADFGPLNISPVYESVAIGFVGEPFYNLAVGFETARDVEAVIEKLHAIEALCGRQRGGERYAARTLDLDLLLYGDFVGRIGRLTLPRAEILRYAFVLKPLADIAGGVIYPPRGPTIQALWEAFDATQQPLQLVPLLLTLPPDGSSVFS